MSFLALRSVLLPHVSEKEESNRSEDKGWPNDKDFRNNDKNPFKSSKINEVWARGLIGFKYQVRIVGVWVCRFDKEIFS